MAVNHHPSIMVITKTRGGVIELKRSLKGCHLMAFSPRIQLDTLVAPMEK